MAFDIDDFKLLFLQYLTEFNLESMGMWSLADDVFAAQVKEKGKEGTGYIFFHDIASTDFRSIDCMCSEMQIFADNAVCGKMTQDDNDTMHVIFLWGNEVSNCPLKSIGSVYHAATQLLVRAGGNEVEWYAIPCQIK
jgi:hypothetical protein